MRCVWLGVCLLLAACGADQVEFTEPCTKEIVQGEDLGVMPLGDGTSCTRAQIGTRQYCLLVRRALPLGWSCAERAAAPSAPASATSKSSVSKSAKTKALVAGPYASASKACRDRGGELIGGFDGDEEARVKEAAERPGRTVNVAWADFSSSGQTIRFVRSDGETGRAFRSINKETFSDWLESISVYWECSLTHAQLSAAPFPAVRLPKPKHDGKTP